MADPVCHATQGAFLPKVFLEWFPNDFFKDFRDAYTVHRLLSDISLQLEMNRNKLGCDLLPGKRPID
jgi:hypothetical protein